MKQLTLVVLALAPALLLQSPRAVAQPAAAIDSIEVIETPVRNPHDDSRARAKKANADAAVDAVNRIAAAARLDLDIHMAGHTSVLVAGTR